MAIEIGKQIRQPEPTREQAPASRPGDAPSVQPGRVEALDGFEPETELILGKATQEQTRHVVGTGDQDTQTRIDALMSQKPSETQQATEARALGRIDRKEYGDKLINLAASDFSIPAQEKFVRYMKGVTEPKDIAWAVDKLRHVVPDALPESTGGVAPLQSHLRAQGFKLLRSEPALENDRGYQLSRSGYRNEVRGVLAGLPKNSEGQAILDRRAVNSLLAPLSSVVDNGDLYWAHWRIEREIKQGHVAFEDEGARERLERFFTSRIDLTSEHLRPHSDGHVNQKEIGYELFRARQAGFSPEAMRKVEGLVDRVQGDADTLFYAKRVFLRELHKGMDAAKTPEERARLAALGERFVQTLAPQLEGKLDRYAKEKELEKLERSGQIDAREMRALKAAAVTSHTQEEYTRGAMRASATLGHVIAIKAMSDAWEQIRKNIEQAASDDERDSFGRVIRTSLERHLEKMREVQRRLEAELTERQQEYWLQQLSLESSEADLLLSIAEEKTAEGADDRANDVADRQQERSEKRRPGPKPTGRTTP